MKIDYSIYLVTATTNIPKGSTFMTQVKNAIDRGATIVQLREKHLSTRDFIHRAREVLRLTRPRNIPLIINDRIDVALAVDAEGVHVGQDDMPASTARKLIGPKKILGVSCTTPEEVEQVCKEKVADYVGLGTLYPTATKAVKHVCGPLGVRSMLRVMEQHQSKIKSVAIGGINEKNAADARFFCRIPGRALDGVAVVSCIMASQTPGQTTAELVSSWKSTPPWKKGQEKSGELEPFSEKPLVHHITNNVVKNLNANVTLAFGGSPIMSELPEEYAEFASLPSPGSLIINLGTPNAGSLSIFTEGLRTYNAHNKPVLLDPVAAGASQTRLEACRVLLNAGYFSVIKGNVGEILALNRLIAKVDKTKSTMQGVDSTAKINSSEVIRIGKALASEFQTILVITGEQNIVVDATISPISVTTVDGGHSIMGTVTGTGCSLGSAIATFMAVARYKNHRMGPYVARAVQLYNKAGVIAESRSAGPGSFTSEFLDALSSVRNGRHKQYRAGDS